MTSMPHLASMVWNDNDELRQAPAGSGTVYFQYAGGQRIRKFEQTTGAMTKERIYIGGWEVSRERSNGTVVSQEIETLHVHDDVERVLMVEEKTIGTGTGTYWRYQLSNHLGSASAELDNNGVVFSYEEFHPFGTSAYRAHDSSYAASPRRYRFTSMERDSETGLAYHGARYYAPWLGRWTAADPIGLGDGVNRYSYVSGHVPNSTDLEGTHETWRMGADGKAVHEPRDEPPSTDEVERDREAVEVPTESGHLPRYRGKVPGYAFRSKSHTQFTAADGSQPNLEHVQFLKGVKLSDLYEKTSARTKSLWRLQKAVAGEGDSAAINSWDNQILSIGSGYSASSGSAGRIVNRMPDEYRDALLRVGVSVDSSNEFHVLDVDTGVELSGDAALHFIQNDEILQSKFIELAQSDQQVTREGRTMEMREWMVRAQFEEFAHLNREMPSTVLQWKDRRAIMFAIKIRHWVTATQWSELAASGGDPEAIAAAGLRIAEKYRVGKDTAWREAKIKGIARRLGFDVRSGQ